MEIERTTGYRDWYDWQVDNWGCKWGCSEFEWLSDDQTAFFMATPSFVPEPIFHELVTLFPSLTFECHFVGGEWEIDGMATYAA